jgi:predicted small metal-binding protein
MEKVLRCDCGFEVRADTDEEFVAGVRRHALDVHGMELTAEDALLVALRADLDSFAAMGASSTNEREETR